MDERFRHYERPPLPPSGRRRVLGAIAVMALALVPVFMLFLALVAAIMNPSNVTGYAEDYFGAFPEILFQGLVPGVPLALVYAALLSLIARGGWDSIGVSLAAGIALSLVLEIAFVIIGMPDDSPGVWDLIVLFLPFACTSTGLRHLLAHGHQPQTPCAPRGQAGSGRDSRDGVATWLRSRASPPPATSLSSHRPAA